jgi:hypothetical protein
MNESVLNESNWFLNLEHMFGLPEANIKINLVQWTIDWSDMLSSQK